ncbi:MAG: hypothetical protein H0W83_18565, partial [Planctomycetes bacterium]|nr:hypothetical protein [Planctomycetota bacterium]
MSITMSDVRRPIFDDGWQWKAFLALVLLVLLAAGASAAEPFIWWEAEAAIETNFPKQNPFAPGNEHEAEALSGGAWIGASNTGVIQFAEYDVAVDATGARDFYVRKFWQHGPFRWRFDDQPWRTCGADAALLDSVELRQFICANWVALGSVDLAAGKHRLRVELLDPTGGGAFDCFLLIAGDFTPRGKLKPGERWNRAPEGWFAFEPAKDAFAPSAIDLRRLNETVAGDGGFIVASGDHLVHQKTGETVRFWGINCGHDVLKLDRPSIDAFARHLAKLGVNLVRCHGS